MRVRSPDFTVRTSGRIYDIKLAAVQTLDSYPTALEGRHMFFACALDRPGPREHRM